ncbi:gluconokinase [Marinobacter panjinensis]|nr:gluconokinase [Marinobacter panjinensis]MCR8914630.1 gluconokinase [Marinobacter panjinensis]
MSDVKNVRETQETRVPKVVVMGVSGCGKSLTGTLLASELGVPFYDADDYHSRANVEKMAAGIPLTDADRLGWLDDLAKLMRREEGGLVLACSALKRAYRERLRNGNPQACFVYLKGDFETIWARHSRRTDHYFNGRAMLESQFQLLEEPGADEKAVVVDVSGTPEQVIGHCLARLGYDRHL